MIISEVGHGTWKYHGGPELLRRGIDLSALLIDTAETYGTEVVVGEAIRGRRDHVFVSTKVFSEHLRLAHVQEAARATYPLSSCRPTAGRESLIPKAFDMREADYVVKPFSPTDLAETIRATLRKRAVSEPLEPHVFGDLTIDHDGRRVTLAGPPVEVEMVAIEYQMPVELSAHAERVLTYKHLLQRVRGEKSSGDARARC